MPCISRPLCTDLDKYTKDNTHQRRYATLAGRSALTPPTTRVRIREQTGTAVQSASSPRPAGRLPSIRGLKVAAMYWKLGHWAGCRLHGRTTSVHLIWTFLASPPLRNAVRRSPPAVRLFLVVIYRRYIAQYRLKSVWFTTSRKINSLRVLRNLVCRASRTQPRAPLSAVRNAVHRPPPAVHRPPSAVYRPPPAIYRLPSTFRHPPPVVRRPPPAVYHPPPAVHHPPPAVYRPPPTAHRPPSTIHRPPFIIHRPPSTAHRPPPTAHLPPFVSCHRANWRRLVRYQVSTTLSV